MSPKLDNHEQIPVVVPNLSMKDLLDVIPYVRPMCDT